MGAALVAAVLAQAGSSPAGEPDRGAVSDGDRAQADGLFEEAMTVFLDELAVPFEEGEHPRWRRSTGSSTWRRPTDSRRNVVAVRRFVVPTTANFHGKNGITDRARRVLE
jgi:hypothetical protein